jgi:hypothetical protein
MILITNNFVQLACNYEIVRNIFALSYEMLRTSLCDFYEQSSAPQTYRR